MRIDSAAAEQAWKIWKLGQTEPEYEKMLLEIRVLEHAYEHALTQLPQEQETVVRDYVALCEAMSWRMLQIACAMMDFPGDDG